jgi:hypothetical protein
MVSVGPVCMYLLPVLDAASTLIRIDRIKLLPSRVGGYLVGVRILFIISSQNINIDRGGDGGPTQLSGC